MALLLLGHAADDGRCGRPAEHGELPLIDAGSAVFAGVIDADHACDILRARGIAGQGMHFLAHAVLRLSAGERSANRQNTTSASDASRFHPASDTPSSAHCGSSQRTGCCAMSCLRKSSMLPPLAPAPVQAVGPANQCCSTPT